VKKIRVLWLLALLSVLAACAAPDQEPVRSDVGLQLPDLSALPAMPAAQAVPEPEPPPCSGRRRQRRA